MRRGFDLGDGLRLAAAALVLGLALANARFGDALQWLPLLYLLPGVAAVALYALDKRAATAGRWRVPEANLHLLDLLGGIAGGLLAQVLLRHKTRKRPFVIATALIAALHLALLALLVLGV